MIAPALLLAASYTQAQDSTELNTVIVTVNKWEQRRNEVPNMITRIVRNDVVLRNPQTTADLLGQSGSVFIQKSQLGGGSPMLRGFATNRVLIVLDGVRMNNAIYRSGNLQNVLSVDPLSINDAEVVFGPGSLIYGSDAIGGVMDFHTIPARISTDGKTLFRGSALVRYSSVNNERTVHADANVGGKRWSYLASVTVSMFGDLRMGRNGGADSYLRPEYIGRINDIDSIVPNSNPHVQRFSGYEQWNVLQKLLFRATSCLNLQYTYNYARTGEAPRYDRLIQYRNGRLRFAEWNYGPMVLHAHQLLAQYRRATAFYNEARFVLAYQSYEESRIDRQYRNNNRNVQTERVHAPSFNADLERRFGLGQLFYGAEAVYNRVGSSSERIHTGTGASVLTASRYPDGSTWGTAGLYASYKANVHPKLTVSGGLRYSYNFLNADFDTAFFRFPYQEARLQKGAITGNAGIVFRPDSTWQLNGLASSGYRMPNVDDIGKLFESTPGMLTVPNPGLQPEYAWNFEVGVSKNKQAAYRVELNGFYTLLTNAIVRRPFSFRGRDSLDYAGVRSGVEALQNVAQATVWGLQASAEWTFLPWVTLYTHANWIRGRETDDARNAQVPLRHAPPFYGSSGLRFKHKRLVAEAQALYNAAVRAENMPPSESAKTDIYASDAGGKPYSPSWEVLHLRASYSWKMLQLTAGWENITDRRYRPYSSGIVAGGSGVSVSLRATW